MNIYRDDSPEQDWQREQAAERRAKLEALRTLERCIEQVHEALRNLPKLKPVEVEVDLSVADRLLYGVCPECGEAETPRHICLARD
jgi:hypothetical protein